MVIFVAAVESKPALPLLRFCRLRDEGFASGRARPNVGVLPALARTISECCLPDSASGNGIRFSDNNRIEYECAHVVPSRQCTEHHPNDALYMQALVKSRPVCAPPCSQHTYVHSSFGYTRAATGECVLASHSFIRPWISSHSIDRSLGEYTDIWYRRQGRLKFSSLRFHGIRKVRKAIHFQLA